MRTISYRIGDLNKATIHIGRVAENDYTRVQIDAGEIYAEYPHAAAALTVQPPAGEAYPAVVTREGDLVIWDVPDSALTEEGMGEIQLTFTDEETVVKSAIGRISVCRSIIGEGEAPDPLEDFLAEAGAALTAIPETIEAALEEAKESGEFDGPAGPAGADGTDGFSPVVTVSEISGGHSVSVTDAEGTQTFNVMDGDKGDPGDPGQPGYSPSASVTKSGSTATIVITDKDGTTTAQISDGEGADVIDDTAGDGDTDKTWSADKLSGLNSAINGKYTKPETGIPASDLASGVIPDVSGKANEPTGTKAAGKVYGLNSNLEPVWVEQSGGSVDPSDIEAAVDAWLDENITNPDSPPLDRSLSSSSAAAPADMVGVINDYLKIPTSKHFEGTSNASWSLTSIGEMTLKNGVTYNFKYSVPVSGTTIYIYLRNEDNTNIKQESISSSSTERTFTYTCSEANKLVKFAFQVGVSTATTVSVDVTSDEESLLDELLIHKLNLTGWENKGIVPGTGEIIQNSKRLLTVIPKCAKSCLCDSGYSFAVFGWNGSTYLGWYNGSAWSKDPIITRTAELDLTGFVNYTLYVVFVNATVFDNATNISISDNIHFMVKSPTDATLSNYGVPADAKATGDAIPAIDNTLTNAGKAADAKATGDAIAEIESQFSGIMPVKIDLTSTGYIKTNVSPVDINNPTQGSALDGYKYIVVECDPGDEFTVYGKNVGTVAALYTFTDSSYNVLQTSPNVSSNDTYYLSAPVGSSYAIFQISNYVSSNEFWKGINISKKIEELDESCDGYDSPAFFKAKDDISLVASYNGVIELYDALVSAYPNYISKNALTHGNFTNYEYVFSMGNRNGIPGERNQDNESEKPVVLIMSGVHGDERSSVMGLYVFATALCKSASMSYIRNGLTIKIIPVVCPSGFNANTRLNSNGVNINRNFDANWIQTEPGSNYSGASAADQDETQVVQNWMDTNNDAVIVIDWHNSAYVNEISYFATCISAGFAVDAKKGYFYGIDHITDRWINSRNITGNNVIYGYTGTDSNNGTTCAYANINDMPGCLFETSWNVGDFGKDSNRTIGVNAEAFCALIKGIMVKYIYA